MKKEYVMFGAKKEWRDWEEELLITRQTPYNKEEAEKKAKELGYVNVRHSIIDFNKPMGWDNLIK